jgi:AhpC/TSA family.
VRDEDLYCPFVERLSKSKLTEDGMKQAYSHDAQMCSLNMVGTPAADFSFTDIRGKVHRLSDIKSDVTVLFFTNPGCPACREIIDQFDSDRRITAMVASGALAVVNIYIDLELDKWREYASNYPKEWYTGYDHTYTIRTDVTYNVRAIPSLYLLDAQKNVLMKDAPSDKVVAWLDNYSESIKEK